MVGTGARRGRPSKPTHLKVIQGTRKDRVNDREPQPDPDARPEPPEWLDEPALTVWRRLAPDMIAKKVLTGWDVHTFAILCDAVARHSDAAKLVVERGLMVKGDKGRLVKNPAAQLVRDYAAVVATFGGRFGLTPADRSHLLSGETPSQGKAERLLS